MQPAGDGADHRAGTCGPADRSSQDAQDGARDAADDHSASNAVWCGVLNVQVATLVATNDCRVTDADETVKLCLLQIGQDVVGTVVGHYKVTAVLNQGGMGAVYRAEHPLIGKPAVIKLLLAYGADPNLKDWHGRTALRLAAAKNHDEWVHLFKRAGVRR